MSAVQQKPKPVSDNSPVDQAAASSKSVPANAAPVENATESNDATNAGTAKGDLKPIGKAGQKDGKKRRERPPLPDPLPEKLVTKYPEPSKAELNKKIEAHDVILRECFDKLTKSREFYDKRTKIREAGKGEFEGARKRMISKNDELRELFEQRKNYSAQIKSLRDADMNARAEAASSSGNRESDALRNLKTVQDVDDRIKELEQHQQTVSMSIPEEKKLVQQIAFLKHKARDIIEGKDLAFQQEKAAKQARVEKRAELESARKELDKKIDAEKVQLDVFKKAVDDIRAKQDSEIQKLQEETSSINREKVKEKITEEKAAIRKLREEFTVELDKWYLNERIHTEQVRIQKKKRWEAQQAEREARRKKWEEEQAQYPEPDPYQREKDMISGLTVYLQTLLGERVDKPGSSNSLLPKPNVVPSLKTEKNTRTVSTAGKAIGKGRLADQFESLAFSEFVEKKSKTKGKKGRRMSVAAAAPVQNANSDDTLKPASIDLLAAFTHLEITPPMKFNEVRGALEAVKQKKEYYDSDPPPPEPKAENEAPKKSVSEANGKAPVSDMTSSGAFPGLNGSEETQPKASDQVNSSSRPSFSEIAKGVAAPAPAAVSTVYPTMPEPEDAMEAPAVEAAVSAQPVAFTES